MTARWFLLGVLTTSYGAGAFGMLAGRPGRCPGPADETSAVPDRSSWWWLGRPALVVFFASGLVLGMVQAAVLSYLPLYAVQALGFDAIGAGFLVACSQAGGAVSRLARRGC